MKITNILVPFNLLIDIDMGLIKLVQYDYHNTEYFYEGMMNADEVSQQYALVTRTNKNPLSILTKEEIDQETIDELYKQFMEKEYDQILELSSNTMISNFIFTLNKSNNSDIIRITALCNSQKEVDLLKYREINVYKTIIGSAKDVSLSSIDTIIVKDIDDLDNFRYLHMMNIYIADYWFNITLDPENPNPLLPIECIQKYGSENEFQIISVYTFKDEDIPLG